MFTNSVPGTWDTLVPLQIIKIILKLNGARGREKKFTQGGFFFPPVFVCLLLYH
jgi:hypothetical protein